MRLKAALIPVAASAALLAGCADDPAPAPTASTNGIETRPADEIMDAAIDALTGAASFRMVVEPGPFSFATPVDLVFVGADVSGTVGGQPGEDVEVALVGETAYLKADAAFWELNLFLVSDASDEVLSDLAADLDGVWAAAPAELAISVVSNFLDVESLFTAETVVRPLTKDEVGTVDGTPVIEVIDADDVAFSVALVGEPYVLRITEDGGVAAFTEIDADVTITAPSGAEDLLDLLVAVEG